MSRLPAPTTATPQRGVARPVSRPHDSAEREADRAADAVAGGGHVRDWSLATAPPRAAAGPAPVQRQEAGGSGSSGSADEDRNAAEYREAAETTARAVAATPAAQQAIDRIRALPEVRAVERFATSPAGLAIGGAALAGGLTGLALAGRPLPFQSPAIPLDRVGLEGWKATPRVTGPLNAPTFVGLTLDIPFGPRTRRTPRREETAATPAPATPLTDAEIAEVVRQITARSPLGIPVIDLAPAPGLQPSPSGAFQLREPFSATGRDPSGLRFFPEFNLQLGGSREPARREDEPVQRSPADGHAHAAPAGGHADVDAGFAGAGRPLRAELRRTMEARFGHDFSRVRLHDDSAARSAAAGVDAEAFTVGDHVVAGPGADLESNPRLLAHELAHVVQQRRSGDHGVHRQARGGAASVTRAEPTTAIYAEFVDDAIRYLESSADHWRTIRRIAEVPAARAPATATGPAPAGSGPTTGATAATGTAATPPARTTGLLEPERLRTVLRGLLDTYEGSRRIIAEQLSGDAARQQRLQEAYVAAVSAARAAATSSARVNVVIIAEPKEVGDAFIANATTYASLYYGRGGPGDTVETVTDVGSPAALLDAIERAAPDRMLGRIDIFAHGTIEPTHQIKFGTRWYRASDIEAAAAARATTGASLQSQTRFDGSTIIELHACRLGAATSQTPAGSADTPTTGTDFLTSFGRSLGGARGQQVVAYEQRWVPRRFSIPGVASTADVGTSGHRAAAFDRMAVQVWDTAMAGGTEATSQLTEAERQPGATITRERKIEIMRRLYDAAGGAWLIGHQYTGADPQSTDPVRDVGRARDTFSNEADWQHRVLQVTVPTPTAVTP